MIPKKNKGSALLVVIMVMAVMTILGVSILNISLSQTKQAANEEKRIQAHYLARSGAEATLSAWLNPGENKPKPSGTCKGYLDSSNDFKSVDPSHPDIPPDAVGNFVVTVLPGKQVGVIVIKSVADVGDVKQTVTVTIKPVTTEIPISPGHLGSGATLKWYDPDSGQASVGNHTIGDKGVTVLVSDPGLKVVHGTPVYQADSIKFTTGIWNFKYPLALKTGILIFDPKITINTKRNGGNDGRLVLQVLPSVSVTRIDESGEWGRIKYKSKWYYYSDNTQILTDKDIEDLEEIPEGDDNNPYSSKQEITKYSIIWS